MPTMHQPTSPTATPAMSRKACIAYLQAHGAYSGHSRDSHPQLQALVAELQAERAPADANRNQAAADADAEPTGSKPTAADAQAHVAAKGRAERLALAKAEQATLAAWAADGSKPPQPPTPNLDAINAEANGPRTATGGKAKPLTTRAAGTPRADHMPRYAEAMAAKKARQRTVGKPTQEALEAYVAKVLADQPDASRNQALEIAYWLDGMSVSRTRWNAAWDAAVAARKAA